MSPQDRLERAAVLIEAALAEIHDHPRTCPCCDKTVYGNWEAHLLLESLLPLPNKLRRFARGDRAFEQTIKVA